MIAVHWLIGTVALATLLPLTSPALAERFAIIGDTPYSAGERALLPRMLQDIAADGAGFIVHIGDIKNGRTPCSDALFADRLALFSRSPIPFVFVPGDNEWSDCNRTSNGGFKPTERLKKLRSLFYTGDHALGEGVLALERQSPEWPEHQRWQIGNILLLTLNVPGGDNNWGTKITPSAEYTARMTKVGEWIDDSFRLASERQLAGLVVLMQANPGFRHFRTGLGNRSYRTLLEQLVAKSKLFPGAVLVAHGDTHRARVDQPLPEIARLIRAETPGYPFMGWISVDLTVDPEAGVGKVFDAHVRMWAPGN